MLGGKKMRVEANHPYAGDDLAARMRIAAPLCAGSTFTYPPDCRSHRWSSCIMCLRPLAVHGEGCVPGGRGILDLLPLSLEERHELFPRGPHLHGVHPAYPMSSNERRAARDQFEALYGGEVDALLRDDATFLRIIDDLT